MVNMTAATFGIGFCGWSWVFGQTCMWVTYLVDNKIPWVITMEILDEAWSCDHRSMFMVSDASMQLYTELHV